MRLRALLSLSPWAAAGADEGESGLCRRVRQAQHRPLARARPGEACRGQGGRSGRRCARGMTCSGEASRTRRWAARHGGPGRSLSMSEWCSRRRERPGQRISKVSGAAEAVGGLPPVSGPSAASPSAQASASHHRPDPRAAAATTRRRCSCSPRCPGGAPGPCSRTASPRVAPKVPGPRGPWSTSMIRTRQCPPAPWPPGSAVMPSG